MCPSSSSSLEREGEYKKERTKRCRSKKLLPLQLTRYRRCSTKAVAVTVTLYTACNCRLIRYEARKRIWHRRSRAEAKPCRFVQDQIGNLQNPRSCMRPRALFHLLPISHVHVGVNKFSRYSALFSFLQQLTIASIRQFIDVVWSKLNFVPVSIKKPSSSWEFDCLRKVHQRTSERERTRTESS